jgi:hypothetical protein
MSLQTLLSALQSKKNSSLDAMVENCPLFIKAGHGIEYKKLTIQQLLTWFRGAGLLKND